MYIRRKLPSSKGPDITMLLTLTLKTDRSGDDIDIPSFPRNLRIDIELFSLDLDGF